METALITGGGDYIAFTIGRMKALKKSYDLVIGTSAGALIAPFIVLDRLDVAESAISNLTPSSIFSLNPFNKKGKIKILNAVYRIVLGKPTLGENLNLPKFLRTHYLNKYHEQLQKSDKKVYVTVCNTNKADYPGEIVCLNDCTYDQAILYMWASASFPGVCSLVKIGEFEYSDGGTTLNVPVDFLVEQGIKTMDVFMHDTQPTNENRPPVNNVFNLLGRIVKWQRQKVQYDQILNLSPDVHANIFWLPYNPEKMALTFDKNVMRQYMIDGFNQIKGK